MWHKDPARIIINAVKGMLPKNRQRIYRWALLPLISCCGRDITRGWSWDVLPGLG